MSDPILGANHRLARVDIPLPLDAAGDYAFDEDGNPIKGKTPVVLSVPRLDALPRAKTKALIKAMDDVADLKDEDGKPLDEPDRIVEMVTVLLRGHCTDDELTLVRDFLTLFEVKQVYQRITTQSALTAGELLASTNS